ncbi:MAG: response regulator, partial [Calditrichaeota bacterium]|nr:response regulator [Calditrichota bacterium]
MQNSHLIFIVEDDLDIREIIQDNLKREGYKTVSFDDGSIAYDAIEKEKPSLIILDLNLP